MKTVYKYPIARQIEQYIDMPVEATILSFHAQDDCFFIWVLLPDTEALRERRHFRLFGTGEEMPRYPNKYVGTIHDHLNVVWHLFEDL